MLIYVLLLINQISCDWVEISQNHYKKEPQFRTTQQPTNQYEEKLQDYRIYRNNSGIEKQWNKATVDRVAHISNIRRAQETNVKTSSIKQKFTEYESTKFINDDKDENQRDIENSYSKNTPFHKEDIFIKHIGTLHEEKIYKPANIGSVKRLQSYNTKSDNLSLHNRNKTPIDDERISPNKESDENKIYKEQDFGTISDANNQNRDFSNGEYNVRNFQRIRNSEQNPPIGKIKIKPNLFNTSPIPTKGIDVKLDTDEKKYFQKIGYFDEDIDIKGLTTDKNFEISNITIATKPKYQISKIDGISIENANERKTKLDIPHITNVEKDSNIPKGIPTNENIQETKDINDEVVDRFEEVSNVTKGEKMSALWKLVKVVSDTIYKNTHRSFKGKIKYLENLKARILSNIEEQFDNMWPDDMEHRSSRIRRARSAQARGHVEFPSSESTLMTISFLTFAVFLIKLVLQVIHTYKNKTMMVTPAVVAAVGRATAALRSQH